MSQKANSLQNTFLRNYPFLIPAGGEEIRFSATGNYVMVKEYIGGDGNDFQMAFEDQSFFDVNLGLDFPLPAGDAFGWLRFRQKEGTTEAIEVEIYAGSVNARDQRLNIVRGRAAPVMKAETISTGHSTTIVGLNEIDLTDDITFPPPNPRYIRAATLVTNLDPSLYLDIANADDDIILSVPPGQPINYESSEPVKIQNNNATDVVARISQLWYVNN